MIKHPEPAPLSKPAQKLWSEVRERAALIGPFDPLALIGGLKTQRRLDALTALADECMEIVVNSLTRWQLNPDSRRRILQALIDSGRLEAAASALPAGDTFGHYLVETLLGRLTIPRKATAEELDAIHSAVQFAASVDDKATELAVVEHEVARREVAEAISSLLPRGLVGREYSLRRLRHFIRGDGESAPSLMMISGVGGAGKSALLAELARRLHHAHEDTPVVWLDFDRAGLAQANQVTLTLELARQLSAQLPAHAVPLAAFRSELEDRFDADLDSQRANFSVWSTRHSAEWSLWREYGLSQALGGRRIVLIVDTLEEVLAGGDGRRRELMAWLRALSTDGGLSGARTILAGRLQDRFEDWSGNISAPHIRLGNLGPVSAVRLLEANIDDTNVAVAQDSIRALVDQYGGNPLTLSLLGRYLREEGASAAEALLEEAGAAKFGATFGKAYLYRRILGRIRNADPGLRAIASPGLLLRRVTPDLIEHVLAQPCELGAIDAARAEQLYDSLSEQVWLVEARSELSAVRHRRDLRRLVFGTMNSENPELSRRIHSAAAEYYAAHRDPELSPSQQDIESIYHVVLAGPDAEFSDQVLMMLAAGIGEDVADLPLRLRARIKLLTGRRLSRKELAAVDEKNRARVIDEASRSAIRRGFRATRVHRTTRELPGRVMVEQAWSEGDFDRLVELGPVVFEKFIDDTMGDRAMRQIRTSDLTDHDIWRVALAAIARGHEKPLAHMLSTRLADGNDRVDWFGNFNENRKISLSLGDAFQALGELLIGKSPIIPRWRPYSEFSIETVDSLRSYQLSRRDIDYSKSDTLKISLSLLCYLFPSYDDIEFTFPKAGLYLHPAARDALVLLQRRNRSHRPALSDLERPRARQAFLEVPQLVFGDVTAAKWLRGVSPELYAPILALMLKSPEGSLVSFVAEVQQRLECWPRELTTDQLSLRLRDDRVRWSATVVETADRCGELSRLVGLVGGMSPDKSLARSLRQLLRVYNQRLTS